VLQLIDGDIHLPALTSAHSHAFQRGMRGRAQRHSGREDNFWSWREAMYEQAFRLDPESLYQISRVAFEELRRGGVRTVGEFHYVHHQADGTPYDERVSMSEAVIRAARDEKLRICLLRVIYHRAGPNQAAAGAQLRFSDDRLDDALADVEKLWADYADDPYVRIGIAPHSVRAVPPAWLDDIAAFAARRKMPVHMHIAEQPKEVEMCLAETKRRPVELVADHGLLSNRFVAVHATHINESEAKLLGSHNAFVCLCPTTERDLGDGFANVENLVSAGIKLCVGVDSHVLTSPLEELRMVELGERLRTGRRNVLKLGERSTADELWKIGSVVGARACAFEDTGGTVMVDRAARELSLVPDEYLMDAIVFSGTDRVFMQIPSKIASQPPSKRLSNPPG
jgi:formiminoglutamate deiminase